MSQAERTGGQPWTLEQLPCLVRVCERPGLPLRQVSTEDLVVHSDGFVFAAAEAYKRLKLALHGKLCHINLSGTQSGDSVVINPLLIGGGIFLLLENLQCYSLHHVADTFTSQYLHSSNCNRSLLGHLWKLRLLTAPSSRGPTH